MNRWLSVSATHWRKEADLPAGHAVAEIWQQGELALYRARVEVAFAQEHTPQRLVKALMGLQSPNEAETACNKLLAEIVAAGALDECSHVHTGPEGHPPSPVA